MSSKLIGFLAAREGGCYFICGASCCSIFTSGRGFFAENFGASMANSFLESVCEYWLKVSYWIVLPRPEVLCLCINSSVANGIPLGFPSGTDDGGLF